MQREALIADMELRGMFPWRLGRDGPWSNRIGITEKSGRVCSLICTDNHGWKKSAYAADMEEVFPIKWSDIDELPDPGLVEMLWEERN